MTAKTRYDELCSERTQFLDEARQASELTLPYLIRGHEESYIGMKQLKTPWQSVGAKGVVTLASKLMLALLPPQTSSSSCNWMTVRLEMSLSRNSI